jgi:hypothetical protein
MRVVGIIVGILVVVVGLGAVVTFVVFPRVSDPELGRVVRSADAARRGLYLANYVMGCLDCHSRREEDLYSMPPVRSAEFGGGFVFTREMGIPGTLVSPNISPGGIDGWTDGEVVRAIAAGVSRDGRPLFPLMPYHNFGTLDKEDIESVVAYLRIVPAVRRPVQEKSSLDFPVNVLIRFLPRDPDFRQRPNPRDSADYGEYMVRAAGCADCHTARDAQGNPVGPAFAGGMEMVYPGRFLVRPANLTPDSETGIGRWTREQFVARFKSKTDEDYRRTPAPKGSPNTIMPWWAYSGMTAEDLGAIYDYLRTLAPVRNQVVTFEPR